MTRATVVERDGHTVVAEGRPIDRTDLTVETSRPGTVSTSRSSQTGILGETGYLNLIWSVEVEREQPFAEDPFPASMPTTIANLSVHGREDRTEGFSPDPPLEYMYMDHLYVQEEARGMGYGQLLWDCYVALVAHGDLDAHGKVGDDLKGSTVEFVASQGVPRSDIEHLEGTAWLGRGSAKWATDGENVITNAPVV